MATYSIDKIKYGSDTYKLSPEATEIMNLIYPIGSIYMSVNNVSPQTFLGGTWEAINGRFLVAQGSNGSSGNDALNLTAGNSGGYTAPQNSAHSHGAGTLAADSTNLAHTHETGSHYHTLNSHTHGVGSLSVGPSEHKLRLSSFKIGTSTTTRNGPISSAGYSSATFSDGHTISGATGSPTTPGNNTSNTTYSTRNSTTGALSGTAYTGAMSANANHGHTISGSTDSTSAVTSGNLPPYLAVYMWKRTA